MDSGVSAAQQQQQDEINQQQAQALQDKITGIQADIGSRTRDLVARYGVVGGSTSPLTAGATTTSSA